MDERQKRLLQDMLKFSKCSDGLAAVGFAASAGSGKTSSPSTAPHHVGSKEKAGTVNQTPKKTQTSTNTSDTHFSGSAFLSSPDPSTIPLPAFDENDEPKKHSVQAGNGSITNSGKGEDSGSTKNVKRQQKAESPVQQDKTEILKKFLKVRKA
jgi:hypothetical protein